MKRKLLHAKVTTVIGGGLTAKAMRETATLTDASWSPQLIHSVRPRSGAPFVPS